MIQRWLIDAGVLDQFGRGTLDPVRFDHEAHFRRPAVPSGAEAFPAARHCPPDGGGSSALAIRPDRRSANQRRESSRRSTEVAPLPACSKAACSEQPPWRVQARSPDLLGRIWRRLRASLLSQDTLSSAAARKTFRAAARLEQRAGRALLREFSRPWQGGPRMPGNDTRTTATAGYAARSTGVATTSRSRYCVNRG